MSNAPVVMAAGERPAPAELLGTQVTVLAAASKTGSYGITYQEGPEGTGPPPHRHDWAEAFFVLSGEVHFQCDGAKQVCSAGAFVHVPGNMVHAFSYGPGGGSMLEITSRDSQSAEAFTEVSEQIDFENPDIPKMVELFGKRGVSFET